MLHVQRTLDSCVIWHAELSFFVLFMLITTESENFANMKN